MQCPYCGTDNEDKEMYCTNCGVPLGDTVYRPIRNTRRVSRAMVFVIPAVLILLLIGGLFGYRYIVRKSCLKATDMIFDHARTLDFSDIDRDLLPEALKDQPNLRALIEDELKTQLKASPFGNFVPVDDLDLDPLVDEIVKNASYTVTNTDVSWNRCTVTIRTSNTDFSKLPESLAGIIQKDVTDTESDLWQAISQQIGNIFNGDKDKTEAPDWNSIIMNYYNAAAKNADTIEKEGRIVYGFDGTDFTKWTIKDYDRDLIRGFYGWEIPDEILDRVLPPAGQPEQKEN